jgi:hypothetical protein
MRGRFAVLAALVLVLLVPACGSSGTLTVAQPKTQAIPPGKVAALSVTAEDDADSRNAAARLREILGDRLVAARLFKEVVPAGQPADYRITIALSDVDTVSDAGRILFGVMAGDNELTGDVTVIDVKSGGMVTRFQVTGAAPSTPIEGENGIEGAIRQAAKQTIEGLK